MLQSERSQRRNAMKRIGAFTTVLMVLCLAAGAAAIDKTPFKMREDFGTAMLQENSLQYYYYVPCPTYSWFWGFSGWSPGDIIGQFFTVGDTPTGSNNVAHDPDNCHDLTGFRFIDFAGYGTLYPGLFTVEFEVYCADTSGCPKGLPLWTSDPYESHYSWNHITVSPALILTDCSTQPGPSSPRFLIIARHIGSDGTYPAWGFDNISWPLRDGCQMHEGGCLPALYPRPYTSQYDEIHTAYYGTDFESCVPYLLLDGLDTTYDGSMYGFVELAFKIFLECNGPGIEPTTWSRVKSMFR
jgi:hypothetical protein